jgi:hypothetical protein
MKYFYLFVAFLIVCTDLIDALSMKRDDSHRITPTTLISRSGITSDELEPFSQNIHTGELSLQSHSKDFGKLLETKPVQPTHQQHGTKEPFWLTHSNCSVIFT